ncbi:MAG: CocE/NonD family hydrolase [Euryarchaeota archaeon]|nr:CocE/NonD family hydrolase [Euryarchaeota archaeon]
MRSRVLTVLLAALAFSPILAGCLGSSDDPAEPTAHEVDEALTRLPGVGLKTDNLTGPVHGILDVLIQRIQVSIDGIRIYAEVYLPDGDGPWPTILEMSPYNLMRGNGHREELLGPTHYLVTHYVPRGYAVVLAHVRGTGNSEGCMDMMGPKEQQDGHDVVEWIAGQKWSDGKVGMHGVSYVGTTPHAAAIMDPPHLTTVVTIAGVTNQWRNTYQNGVPYEGRAYPVVYNAFSAPPPTDVTSGPDWALNTADAACDQEEPLAHMAPGTYEKGVYTDYWAGRDMTRHVARVNASVFYNQGFDDRAVNPMEAIDWFNALDVPKKGFFHQEGHRLPPRDDYRLHEQAWFDHWLKGLDTGIMDTPIVEVQLNGGDIRVGTQWPPIDEPGTTTRTFHLAPGTLAESAPEESEESYTAELYKNGPGHPLATEPPERLTYRTEALDAPLHVVGPAQMHVMGSVDAENTYWLMDLFDVAPDGATTWIAEGWFNAHLHDGIDKSSPLTPGETYAFDYLFEPREYVFEKGHRIELRVNAHHPGVFPSDGVETRNTIHYGPEGSTITLPILTEAFVHKAPESVSGEGS